MQKIKTFSVTRQDDMYLAVAQVETQANKWLQDNPEFAIVALTATQSTSPETEIHDAKHTATVVVAYAIDTSLTELHPIACPPLIDVMPILLSDATLDD